MRRDGINISQRGKKFKRFKMKDMRDLFSIFATELVDTVKYENV